MLILTILNKVSIDIEIFNRMEVILCKYCQILFNIKKEVKKLTRIVFIIII